MDTFSGDTLSSRFRSLGAWNIWKSKLKENDNSRLLNYKDVQKRFVFSSPFVSRRLLTLTLLWLWGVSTEAGAFEFCWEGGKHSGSTACWWWLGGGVPRRHLLPSGDSRPFDLGLMSCHVLCLSCSDTCHVRQDYVSPTLICRGLLSLSLSVWVIISILHWGIDLKSLSSYTVYVDLQF